MVLRALYIGFFFLWLAPSVWAGQPPALIWNDSSLHADRPWRVVSAELGIFEDPTNARALRDVQALPDSAFVPLRHECCNFGYERHGLWVRFRVFNRHPKAERFLVEVVNPFITRLTFFQVDGRGNLVRSDSTGTAFPFWKRPEPHRNFIFPVSVARGDSAWVYFAIAPDYPLHLRILFWDAAERRTTQQRAEDILLTVYFVFCLLFLVLSGILITVARQYYLWWYFLYVLVTTIFIPAHLGLGFRYVWPGVPYLQFVVPAALNSLRLAAGIQFFRLYFDLPKNSPRFNRFLRASIGMFLFMAALMVIHEGFPREFMGWVLNTFFGYLMLFSGVILLWVLREIFYKKRRRAWLFVLVGLNFVGVATTSLQYLGYGAIDIAAEVLPFGDRTQTFFVQSTLMAGFFVEMLIVFYYATRRYIRLVEQTHRTQTRLAKAKEEGLNALLLGVENERRRIARDLHDGACVNLAAIKMKVDALQEQAADPAAAAPLAELSADLEQTYREVRGISHDLMSKALEKTDLFSALEDLAARIQQAQPRLNVQLYANFNLKEVGNLAKIQLYRIVQELLANVLKHAQAHSVSVQLLEDAGKLLLTVEDDGRGFEAGKTGMAPDSQVEAGIGLVNVRTRVAVLRGTLRIETAPGRGTFVGIEIPDSAVRPDFSER